MSGGGAFVFPDGGPKWRNGTAANEADQLPERAAIASEHRWDLSHIFADDEAWEVGFAQLEQMLEEADRFRGRLHEGPETLLAALTAQERAEQLLERLFAYARMHNDEDTRQARYQALTERMTRLHARFAQAWAFLEPEFLALPEDQVRAWIETPPPASAALQTYRHRFWDLLRQKPHVLSPAEEELLAQTAELAAVPGTVFHMVNDADLTFPHVRDERGREVELTKSRYTRFLESHDREVRKGAFEALYSTYAKQKNTFGALLSSAVSRDAFYARVRHYPSALAMALDDDNVPETVYTSLIDAVHRHLPGLHRYLRLRRQLLGLDQLHMYDLYVPLVRTPEETIPYTEAVRRVREAVVPLGADYQQRLTKGLHAGWVDVFENQGKTSGAYSWGVHGVHPYVLLNYQGTIDHVFTLAHEFGHAMHSVLAEEAQPYVYAGHSIFVAEVASTTSEALLMASLLDQSSTPSERAYLVNHHLESFRTTVFRQVMFAEFEREIHQRFEQGQALTAESLNAIYRELNCTYYGAEVEVDAQIDLEWARIPHFYNAFYVYKYATGFSSAVALAQAIRDEGAPAAARYLDFLRGGASDYPVALLQRAGVDLTTSEPVERALRVFESLVEQLERLSNGQGRTK